MIIPGRLVQIVIVTSLGVRSITMREIYSYTLVYSFLLAEARPGFFDVALETCIEIFANLAIFEDIVAEVRTTEPVGVPTADNAKSVGDRIDFLTHCCCF